MIFLYSLGAILIISFFWALLSLWEIQKQQDHKKVKQSLAAGRVVFHSGDKDK